MTTTEKTGIAGIFQKLGELRTALVSMAIFSLVMIPLADTTIRYETMGVIPDVITPAVTVLLIFVLLLDALMSRVFMSQHEGAGKERYRFITRLNLILVAALLLGWTPFMIKVLA